MGGEMTHRGLSQRGTFFSAAVSLMLVLLGMCAWASAEPGQAPTSPQSLAFTRQENAENTSLSEFFSATGKLFLSVDGAGANNVSPTAEVEKPNAAATVRQAFVLAAATGSPPPLIANGDVTINGTGINWDMQALFTVPQFAPFGFSNHLADVTSLVKPIVDAAPPGRIPFAFTEVNTSGIDGEVLVVIFDDPTQTSDQTIVLLFGAQDISGDTFAITLANPIDPAAPGALVDMGLGISFSFQPGSQVSIVEVNGTRVTSSAGGQDDGQSNNGALITVGGLDDSNANPSDPLASPGDFRTDDELYSLLPFITAADTTISVFTQNPSNDDNIFFAYFRLSAAAIIGEGIVLGPVSSINTVGTTHTVTARVVDNSGNPVPDRVVTFQVISGPNAGDNGTATTAANGEATFTYTGDGGGGIDEIQASFVNPATEETSSSNTITKEWLAPVVIAIGDVTGNGVLDVDDARLILAVLVGLLSPVDVPNFGAAGDVNADNTINNLDAAIIAGILAGQVPLLPDSTRTTITDNGDGTATVAGSTGALPPNSTVNITNGGTTTVMAATDGSFSAVLTAVSGNKITIGVDNGPAKIALVVGDSDGDELSDAEESTRGTNPANPDTDGDGFPDGFEVAAGSDISAFPGF
jgi:Bacterial Ig-like domain (group 1)/Bacterial TSP3 repeat